MTARLLAAPAALFALFLGLPVATLIGRAVLSGSLASSGTSAPVVDALGLSLLTTSASLLVTLGLGLPLAILLARRPFPGRALVDAIVDLPIVLPPAVAGLALLLVFGRFGLVGAVGGIGSSIAFTTVAVVLAQTFVAAPFFIRAARAGIAGVDRDLEDAARIDGAGELAVLRLVSLPLAWPVLAGGLVMTWARALGEFGATIMFAGSVEGRTQTLPLLVYGEFQGGDLNGSMVGGAILALAALGVLLAVRVFRFGRALDLRVA
ncbi:MAG TPA: ABC transporter permease [Candidatus Limnocylindrales bacterium]|nr:ABC transporter permease [Candidatus Limnocylindrales bacterium]